MTTASPCGSTIHQNGSALVYQPLNLKSTFLKIGYVRRRRRMNGGCHCLTRRVENNPRVPFLLLVANHMLYIVTRTHHISSHSRQFLIAEDTMSIICLIFSLSRSFTRSLTLTFSQQQNNNLGNKIRRNFLIL